MYSGHKSYWRLFCLPMYYNFTIRLPLLDKRLSWLFINLFPTIYYSLCAVSQITVYHVVALVLFWAATFFLYEFGYMYNDAVATLYDPNPTLRISESESLFARRHLCAIFLLRLMVFVALMIGVYALFPTFHTLIAIGLSCLCPVFFYIYNRWRSTYNAWLYFWLVASRFVPFVWLFDFSLLSISWLLTVLIIVCYPLEIGIERFSYPKRRFWYMRRVIPDEEAKPRFRFYYYLTVTLLGCVLSAFRLMAWQMLLPFVAFLLYRAVLYVKSLR